MCSSTVDSEAKRREVRRELLEWREKAEREDDGLWFGRSKEDERDFVREPELLRDARMETEADDRTTGDCEGLGPDVKEETAEARESVGGDAEPVRCEFEIPRSVFVSLENILSTSSSSSREKTERD